MRRYTLTNQAGFARCINQDTTPCHIRFIALYKPQYYLPFTAY